MGAAQHAISVQEVTGNATRYTGNCCRSRHCSSGSDITSQLQVGTAVRSPRRSPGIIFIEAATLLWRNSTQHGPNLQSNAGDLLNA
jgi:hypothetical protein